MGLGHGSVTGHLLSTAEALDSLLCTPLLTKLLGKHLKASVKQPPLGLTLLGAILEYREGKKPPHPTQLIYTK